MGGEVTADSIIGKGTTFTISMTTLCKVEMPDPELAIPSDNLLQKRRYPSFAKPNNESDSERLGFVENILKSMSRLKNESESLSPALKSESNPCI